MRIRFFSLVGAFFFSPGGPNEGEKSLVGGGGQNSQFWEGHQLKEKDSQSAAGGGGEPYMPNTRNVDTIGRCIA